jgi:hypothetical protein
MENPQSFNLPNLHHPFIGLLLFDLIGISFPTVLFEFIVLALNQGN